MKKELLGSLGILLLSLVGGAILKSMGAPELAVKVVIFIAVLSFLIAGKLTFEYFWKKRR